ncbi:hypothetical protein SDC9_176496 [bioreactor metagenome]|uniref:Uncharacterized protein n=1 Tax=bioreactor metagenome TaxID=1076179 RepID=A0A645GQ68_9ZZZZ
MRELLAESRTALDESGILHRFTYYITVGEMMMGEHLACESYGVKITEDGGGIANVPNLTTSISRIDALMELLIRNEVGPVGLCDVLADWL